MLTDCIKAEVRHTASPEYEMTLDIEYPENGNHAQDIQTGRFVVVKDSEAYDDDRDNQVYEITRVEHSNHTLKIHAEHISYWLTGNILGKFYGTDFIDAGDTLQSMLSVLFPQKILSGIGTENRTLFQFYSDITDYGLVHRRAENLTPTNVRDYILGEHFTSWYKPAYWQFDNFLCTLTTRSYNNPKKLSYGTNLKDVRVLTSLDDCYTAVYPYRKEETDTEIIITDIQNGNKVITYSAVREPKIYPFEISDWMEGAFVTVTDSILRSAADYIWRKIGKNEIPTTIEIDYAHNGIDVPICLNEIVTINYPPYPEMQRRVSAVVFDVLREKNISIALGDLPEGIADKIYRISKLQRGARL